MVKQYLQEEIFRLTRKLEHDTFLSPEDRDRLISELERIIQQRQNLKDIENGTNRSTES